MEIGSGAALNANCSIQTHLFEERVMKMDRLKIGKNGSVGEMSVVLYGSEMGEGAVLGPLSLVMKGERLPANSRWEGSPAQEARFVSGGPANGVGGAPAHQEAGPRAAKRRIGNPVD